MGQGDSDGRTDRDPEQGSCTVPEKEQRPGCREVQKKMNEVMDRLDGENRALGD